MRKMDVRYMEMAIELARKGLGKTSPNPVVGAVIVKDGMVVGKGYHKKAGLPHAEVYAVRDAGDRAEGADIYVTLEPCHHEGRTPPCTDILISAGIKRVFIGTMDPNPIVRGRGIRSLKRAGMEVKSGILRDKCKAINEAYNKYITMRHPFITLKLAASLDGMIATNGGESRWITGESSRRYLHRLRSMNDAIMVGAGTILKDDPELTARGVRGKSPIRIIADTGFRTPLDAKVLTNRGRKIVALAKERADKEKIRKAEAMGVEILKLPATAGGIKLNSLMDVLGRMEITTMLIEGGASLAASVLKEQIVDKICFFYAPKIIGGDGISMIGSLRLERLEDSIIIRDASIKRLGRDFLLEGYI